jgi:uronate dehydrogenase
MHRVAITGAAGRIGSVLRAGLRDRALRLLDLRPLSAEHDSEQVRQVDLRDAAAAVAALAGVDTVIHLAACPDEAPFERILADNIVTTQHLFEAARQQSVRRVVFASSVHVSGFYPWGRRTRPSDPLRPDTYYGVSKVFGEALGSMYADKYGIEVVCLRIAGFATEPKQPAYLSGWLSPGDAVRLFRAALDAPDIRYLVCYGLSANTRGFYARDGWAELGYAPVDDAEAFAHRWPEAEIRWPRHLGIEFTAPDYRGSAAPRAAAPPAP